MFVHIKPTTTHKKTHIKSLPNHKLKRVCECESARERERERERER